MALASGLNTALAATGALVFMAVEIVLPSNTIRLCDGAGMVTFSGRTFTGRDADFGTLGGIDQISDGMDNVAPRYQVTLLPKTDTAVAALKDVGAQGSQVSIWFGAIDPVTGAAYADPELLCLGEFDTCSLSMGAARTAATEVASVWERLFSDSEGVRLNQAWLDDYVPGALGLTYLVEGGDDPYWGANPPQTTITVLGITLPRPAPQST